jgi:hypothetical protein
LWKETRFSVGILASLLPIAAISLLRYGLGNHLDYLNVLAFLSRNGEGFFANNSINGILHSYFSQSINLHWESSALTSYIPIVYAGTAAASLLAVGLVIFPPLLWRDRRPGIADFCAVSICTVVGSPVAWEQHYGILLPIYLVALRCALGMSAGYRRSIAFAAILLSWILVADFIPFAHLLAQTPFRFVQAHCFFGALLLLALLFAFHANRDVGDKSLGQVVDNS